MSEEKLEKNINIKTQIQSLVTSLSIKPLLIYFAIFSVWMIYSCLYLYYPSNTSFQILNQTASWDRWDVTWYKKIWDSWYPTEDPQRLAFPPGYPLIVGYLSNLTNLGFEKIALILNTVSLFFAYMLCSEILSKKFNCDRYAIFCFQVTAPAGYFVFPAYSDAVFALLFWSIIALANRRHELRKSEKILFYLLILIIPLIRLSGYSLLILLLLGFWEFSLCLLTLLVWLGFNFKITGNYFTFLDSQKIFLMPEGNFIDGFKSAFEATTTIFNMPEATWLDFYQQTIPFTYFLLLSLAAIFLLYKRQYLLGLANLGLLLLSHNQALWRSTPRYDLPMYALLALPLLYYAKGKQILVKLSLYSVYILIMILQLDAQLYFATRFYRAAKWAF